VLVLGIDPATTRIALADDQARSILAVVPNLDKGPARMAEIQPRSGRQSASVRATWVAPAAIAKRKPVSAAAPVPFCGS